MALVALLLAAVIGALVVAIVRTHDDVRDRLATCIENSDATVVAGPDVLGVLRADLANRTSPRISRRYRLGDNDAVLLTGTGYRLLAMRGRNGPGLDGNVALRIFEQTSDFSLVAVERDPLRGVLAACASLED
ncbi:hypothetical protein [Paraconexibacter sp.]|uniref:hypothetical protein n=1 Tax=Paraconexibacter sp. TaxID=2949640 RepID=UPI003566F0B8